MKLEHKELEVEELKQSLTQTKAELEQRSTKGVAGQPVMLYTRLDIQLKRNVQCAYTLQYNCSFVIDVIC